MSVFTFTYYIPKPEKPVKYYEPARILLLIPLLLTLLVIVTDSCNLFMSLTALMLISGFNWKVGVGAWNTVSMRPEKLVIYTLQILQPERQLAIWSVNIMWSVVTCTCSNELAFHCWTCMRYDCNWGVLFVLYSPRKANKQTNQLVPFFCFQMLKCPRSMVCQWKCQDTWVTWF